MNIRMFCLELEQCHASHDRCGQATADDGRLSVLSKGYDGMPRPMMADRLCWFKGDDDIQLPTSSDRVCYPRAMMACDTRRHPTICAAQGR